MIQGINSSKKCYFIWLSVFLVLFFGLMISMIICSDKFPDFFGDGTKRLMLVYALPYVIAALPMGFVIRRRFMNWYVNEPEVVYDTNVVNVTSAVTSLYKLFTSYGIYRFAKLVVNPFLMLVYFAVSVIVGVFFNPYFIISGIVLIIKKSI